MAASTRRFASPDRSRPRCSRNPDSESSSRNSEITTTSVVHRRCGVYNLYQHVRDPFTLFDPLGLDWNYFLSDSNGNPYYHGRAADGQTMADVARRHSNTTGEDGPRFGQGDTLNQITAPGTDPDAVRGIEQRGIEVRPLLGRGSDQARGNRIRGISEAKAGTPKGIERLAQGDAVLAGRKPSQMPVLDQLPKAGCP